MRLSSWIANEDAWNVCFKCLCACACVLRWGGGVIWLCVCVRSGVCMGDAKSLGDLTENFIKKPKSIHTHCEYSTALHAYTHTRISLNKQTPKDIQTIYFLSQNSEWHSGFIIVELAYIRKLFKSFIQILWRYTYHLHFRKLSLKKFSFILHVFRMTGIFLLKKENAKCEYLWVLWVSEEKKIFSVQ